MINKIWQYFKYLFKTEIGKEIIGMTVELLIKKFGEPDRHFPSRDLVCGTNYVYGKKIVRVRNGIVIGVREI